MIHFPDTDAEIGFVQDSDRRGLAYCENPEWLQDGLIDPLAEHPVAQRIAFLVFWRNEARKPTVYNVPPVGTVHAPCLATLADHPALRFGSESTDPQQSCAAKPEAEPATA